jgi:hypothetical protein
LPCIRAAGGGPTIKVLYFGISKLTGMSATSNMVLTHATALLGSPFARFP